MSKDQIKDEINKVLDHLPDKTLQNILSFLKNVESKQTLTLADHAILDKILSEDKDLLEKLAKWYQLKKLNSYIEFSLISSEAHMA